MSDLTRAEAIKKIKSLCHDCDEFPHCVNTDPDCFKALEMAIKALEQEPCDDCISREEVCDYIAEFVNHEYATDREHEMIEHIIGGIQHLPSSQPKPIQSDEDCISRQATVERLCKVADFIEIPEGATNGDILNKVFPNLMIRIDSKWWNSPYRKEQE